MRGAEAIMGGIMKITSIERGEENGLMTGDLRDPRWISLSLMVEIHTNGSTRQTTTFLPTTSQDKK